MSDRPDRAPVWAIWLLIVFGAVQPFVWTFVDDGTAPPAVFIPLLVAWVTLLALAALATRRLSWLWRTLSQSETAHRTTLNEIHQLQTQNAMLEIVAKSVDVPLAFQELASRIAGLVPCDRVGMALLSEDGAEFQTYTARGEDESRKSTRPNVVFRVERTMIGGVIRSGEPLIISDMEQVAPDHLDANVVVSAGFRSGVVIPLIAGDRPVGTLNLVSRRPNAFERSHLAPLQPIAELLAVAWVAQQHQMTAGRYQMMETMSDLTLSIASDINSALQTIVGHCDLLARANGNPALDRDLDMIVQQAKRIAELLERMRSAAAERLRQASLARSASTAASEGADGMRKGQSEEYHHGDRG
jgi:transcriptional regulator with GAF, ATPase, and Fis domain